MIIFNKISLYIPKISIIVFSWFCFVTFAYAEVSSFEVTSRQPYAGGLQFGDVGAYEEIRGRIYYEIDPANPLNQVIVDLELAPLNARGMIELSGDIEIITPVNPDNGNNVAIIDIPNRGNRISLRFNKPNANEPIGDGFLMNQGYTLVWVGWEFDIDRGLSIDVPSTIENQAMPIAGLGFAAVRDIGSWIKYSSDTLISADHLISFGLSQSGRYLRNYLYLGFNTDESGRKVYDGMIPHIAGSSKIDLNRRGAEPVSQGQYIETSYPFADEAYTDPVTGLSEGLLENPRASQNQPRIFYTNSAVEYWGGGRVAALVHTSPDGSQDLNLPENVRFYFLAGTQHGPGPFPPVEPGNGQFSNNPLDYWWHMRALLVALTDWVTDDVAPPASAHPKLEDNTLVRPDQVNFPDIPGAHTLANVSARNRADNPLLENQGGAGAALPLLVPQVDQNGNDMSGLLHPELIVPLATYTGWNFNNPGIGGPDQLFPLAGSYIAFAPNREARESTNDPRLSIEERYINKQDFLDKISIATQESIDARYILASDKNDVMERASQHWDFLRD
jgi:hypothetical protein